MISSLALSVPHMDNCELNNLAKNRYIDENIQMAIANCNHLKAKEYLAYNENLFGSARDILLKERSNVIKWALIGECQVNHDPNRIEAIYDATPRRFKKTWRIGRTFLRQSWNGSGHANTPVTLLNKIYDEVASNLAPFDDYYNINTRQEHIFTSISMHPNCTERLAVIFSTSKNPRVSRSGFDALVRIKEHSKSLKLG